MEARVQRLHPVRLPVISPKSSISAHFSHFSPAKYFSAAPRGSDGICPTPHARIFTINQAVRLNAQRGVPEAKEDSAAWIEKSRQQFVNSGGIGLLDVKRTHTGNTASNPKT